MLINVVGSAHGFLAADTGLFGCTCGPKHRGRELSDGSSCTHCLPTPQQKHKNEALPVIGLTAHMVNINVSKHGGKRREDRSANDPDWLGIPQTTSEITLPSSVVPIFYLSGQYHLDGLY